MTDDRNENKIGSETCRKRVAFLFWEGYIGVAPSIMNATTVLVSAGYDVDIITRRSQNTYAPFPKFPDTVHIYSEESGLKEKALEGGTFESKEPHWTRKVWRTFMPHVLRRAVGTTRDRATIISELTRFVTFALACMRGKRYIAVVGVDMLGLIAATAVRMPRRTPVIYWSLEMVFLSEFKTNVMRLFKRLERMCSRRAQFTIIQDIYRAQSLISENLINPSRILIVPNGPLGPPPTDSSQFLQEKFDLKNSIIILQIGMICREVMSLELAEEAASWPDDWVVVLHERAKRDRSDPYLQDVIARGRDKVLLSLEPVPYDQLDTIVRSAHIGLVLYRSDLGPNFAQIAGASGKFGQYLRCGLPVVCLDLPGVREITDEYRCGICVKEIKDIQRAIHEIMENYSDFSTNAVRCYQEVYEFGAHFDKVLHQVGRFAAEQKDILLNERR